MPGRFRLMIVFRQRCLVEVGGMVAPFNSQARVAEIASDQEKQSQKTPTQNVTKEEAPIKLR